MRVVPAAAIALTLSFMACGGEDAPALAVPTIDTLPGGAIAVHNTGPSGWVDTNGWRVIETGRIAAVDSGESGIVNPRAIAVDPAGRLYVVDGPPLVIKIFEANGTFVRSVGREGAGPGEFRSALPGVHANHLVIQDPNLSRLTIFDTSGAYDTSLTSACCHYRPLPVTANGTVAVPGPNSPDEFSGMFLRYTSAGVFIDTVYVPRGGDERFWELAQDGGSMRMTIPFTPSQRSAFMPNGDLVHAWTADYRIFIGPGAADTSRVISLVATPIERPREERAARLEQIIVPNEKNWGPKVREVFKLDDIPATATPFESIMVDPAGAIWAQVYTGDTLATHYDVFEAEGAYLGRVRAPWPQGGSLSWGSPELVVRLGENEDGYPEITQYRVERTMGSAE
ncbi:MAG TPA: hypothetical protein VFT04_12910 [Gemmatimonadales bacterium]|nr:hypothetical protein [Gemmatimonadales bacterium]